MEIQLQKWGNSIGIRIPMNYLKQLKLKENDKVKIEIKEEKIVISKSIKEKISLKELFEKYDGEDLTTVFEWDDPQGGEIW